MRKDKKREASPVAQSLRLLPSSATRQLAYDLSRIPDQLVLPAQEMRDVAMELDDPRQDLAFLVPGAGGISIPRFQANSAERTLRTAEADQPRAGFGGFPGSLVHWEKTVMSPFFAIFSSDLQAS